MALWKRIFFVQVPGFVPNCESSKEKALYNPMKVEWRYDSMSDLGEIRVYQRADFQSGSRVLKKVF